jgi:hypothetical protein
MMWPAPENATLTVFAGTLDLPVRPPNAADAMLPPLKVALTAPPDEPAELRPGLVRIERLGLDLGTERSFRCDLQGEDPLSAVAEMRQTQTMARDSWRIRIETWMRMTCTHDTFRLDAGMRAWEGDDKKVCDREWGYDIPRDFL